MSARRSSVALAAAALLAVAAPGCGGAGGQRDVAADTTPGTDPSAGQRQIPPTSDLALPKRVPDRATGPADRASARVIRRWLRALDRGDVRGAARYFALPSKFQNTGTPVLHIDSEIERIAVNMSLTCGARAERTGGAGAYTIVLFRLIDRPGPGGGCGTGTGATARGAILVSRGRIREWYRLPDRPGGQQRAPAAPSGPAA